MSTIETDTEHSPPRVEPPMPRSRFSQASQFIRGPRDFFQLGYLAVSVVLVGFLFLFAFGLVFNEATLPLWLFFAGFFAFRQGFTEYRNRLMVSGTATARASSAAIGLAELSGRGYASDARDAPVTQTPCLFSNVEVHQWQPGSKKHGWNRKLQRSFGVESLELEDDTGRVLVWTRGAEIIPVKQVWYSKDGNPPEAALGIVTAIGLEWPSPSSRYPMKVTEERIEQGKPLYVMGTLAERRQIPDRPPSFVPNLLERWRNTAPRLDDQSFGAAFRFVSQGARRWFANDLKPMSTPWMPPTVNDHQVLVWKGDQRRPFLISGLLEREALTALSRRAWGSILAGAGLMAGTVLVYLWKLTGVIR